MYTTNLTIIFVIIVITKKFLPRSITVFLFFFPLFFLFLRLLDMDE